MVSPEPQAANLIFGGTVGEWLAAARLAMREFGHFILGGGNHTAGIHGQDILRTLVVEEAVQSGEPERQSPAILCVSKNVEDLRHFPARTMIARIEPIQ